MEEEKSEPKNEAPTEPAEATPFEEDVIEVQDNSSLTEEGDVIEAQDNSAPNSPLTEEEYEKMRTAPRGKSKGDQIVEVKIINGPREGEVLYFEIYDISTGGMGILASTKKIFHKERGLKFLIFQGDLKKLSSQGKLFLLMK